MWVSVLIKGPARRVGEGPAASPLMGIVADEFISISAQYGARSWLRAGADQRRLNSLWQAAARGVGWRWRRCVHSCDRQRQQLFTENNTKPKEMCESSDAAAAAAAASGLPFWSNAHFEFCKQLLEKKKQKRSKLEALTHSKAP